MSAIHIPGWDDSIHTLPKQQRKIKTASSSKTTPSNVDRNSMTGVFSGRGAEPYLVSLTHCTCSSFTKEGKPCKHIYRLAMECGLIDIAFSAGTNQNDIPHSPKITFRSAVAELENLTDEDQIFIKDFLSSNFIGRNNQAFPVDEVSVSVVGVSFLDFSVDSEASLNNMTFPKLREVVKNAGLTCICRRKADIISFCLEHFDEIKSNITLYGILSRSSDFTSYRSVYRYLQRKFDNETECYEGEPNHPHGSQKQGSLYFFPDDEITDLLTLYGHNRCLGGYAPVPGDVFHYE